MHNEKTKTRRWIIPFYSPWGKFMGIVGLIVLTLFFYSNAAHSDAPGVPEPGRRVPPRSSNNNQRGAPANRAPRQAPAPRPVAPEPPVVVAITPLNEAVALIEQERYRKALPLILRALREQPKNPDAWYWFAVWNNKTGNFSNAQKYFAKTLHIDPNYPALSRVVVYPNDPHGKIPLWNPVRPTAVESINPVKEINVVAYGSPESLRESRPETEEAGRPAIPVYLPPDPYKENRSE